MTNHREITDNARTDATITVRTDNYEFLWGVGGWWVLAQMSWILFTAISIHRYSN